MTSWNLIFAVCAAIAFAAYFKVALSVSDVSRGDGSFDEADARIGQLKRARAERGECVYCGAPLGRVASTLTSSVCARCGPDFG